MRFPMTHAAASNRDKITTGCRHCRSSGSCATSSLREDHISKSDDMAVGQRYLISVPTVPQVTGKGCARVTTLTCVRERALTIVSGRDVY